MYIILQVVTCQRPFDIKSRFTDFNRNMWLKYTIAYNSVVNFNIVTSFQYLPMYLNYIY